MKVRLIVISSLLLFLALAAPVALTQTKSSRQKPIELKANKPTTRGEGADPNIKDDTEANDPNSELTAPQQKGGAKTRGGGYCEVRFDNRTRWFVKLYVDGAFRGTISPFGDGIAYTGAGSTRVYAKAQFNDGSFLYWGPTDYRCYAGQYIYFRMNP